MAFIGNTNQTQAFTPAVDYFNGDGVTVAFTLSRPVASVAQVEAVIENVVQNPSSAYTVNGNVITFTSAPASGTSNIYVRYTSPITQVIAPGQGTVSTAQLGNINNINSLTSLALQTNNGTTAVTIDASQNVTFAVPLPVASGGTGSTAGATPPIQPVTATVASSALTVGINATSLQFRSATLTTGVPTTALAIGALSLVVPSTATLGTVSAVQSQLVLVVLYNGGTPALGIVNISGGTNLDETTLLSTTAIIAGSNSASVVYSASAITSSPFRVVGTVVSTQATAGTWATTPSLVQGYGGQAMASMQSLGFGQTWQTVTRTSGTTYYNTTGKPIQVVATATISANSVNNQTVVATVNGVIAYSVLYGCTVSSGMSGSISIIVPTNNSYVVTSSATIATWAELR